MSIAASGKVADVPSLKSADSAMECFTILQDENIFSKRDVIFIQFLCKVTECKELYEKCEEYALSQNALCYFERQIGRLPFFNISKVMATCILLFILSYKCLHNKYHWWIDYLVCNYKDNCSEKQSPN